MSRRIKLKAILAILLMIVCSCTPEDSNITVTDIDGNVYTTVKIGTQVWMVENLKTTKYRNGQLIGTTIPATNDISREIAPKYQWAYNGIESNVSKYGRLYTWYAVNDYRNIAPIGWHVPSDSDWVVLNDYLAANLGTTGSVAKTLASTTGWASSTEVGAIGNDLTKNNKSGFTGIPGGYRGSLGAFGTIGMYGFLWSSTENNTINAWNFLLNYNHSDLGRGDGDKRSGFSVRCIRDN